MNCLCTNKTNKFLDCLWLQRREGGLYLVRRELTWRSGICSHCMHCPFLKKNSNLNKTTLELSFLICSNRDGVNIEVDKIFFRYQYPCYTIASILSLHFHNRIITMKLYMLYANCEFNEIWWIVKLRISKSLLNWNIPVTTPILGFQSIFVNCWRQHSRTASCLIPS